MTVDDGSPVTMDDYNFSLFVHELVCEHDVQSRVNDFAGDGKGRVADKNYR